MGERLANNQIRKACARVALYGTSEALSRRDCYKLLGESAACAGVSWTTVIGANGRE